MSEMLPNKEVWVKVALLIAECEELRINAKPQYPNYHCFWCMAIACMINREHRKENPIKIFILGEPKNPFNVAYDLKRYLANEL